MGFKGKGCEEQKMTLRSKNAAWPMHLRKFSLCLTADLSWERRRPARAILCKNLAPKTGDTKAFAPVMVQTASSP